MISILTEPVLEVSRSYTEIVNRYIYEVKMDIFSEFRTNQWVFTTSIPSTVKIFDYIFI